MSSPANNLYASLSATRRLLVRGRTWSQSRLNADDMLSAAEAAKFAGTDPELLIREAAAGRLIGIPSDSRGMVFPFWQFSPAFKTAIRVVSQELHSSDGWSLLRFFESPHIALDGLNPRQSIERGLPLEGIVDLARAWDFA